MVLAAKSGKCPTCGKPRRQRPTKTNSKFNSAIPSGRPCRKCPSVFRNEFTISSKRFRKNASRLPRASSVTTSWNENTRTFCCAISPNSGISARLLDLHSLLFRFRDFRGDNFLLRLSFALRRRLQQTLPAQLRVSLIQHEQFLVRAALDDAAVIQ